MHVHLPKPLHGWREFLGEVGIIVIGVLIALAAEQIIENLHWRHEVAAGREALKSELTDVAAQSIEREAISGCLGKRFQDIALILDEAAASGQLPPVGIIGNPSRRLWHLQAWDSLMAAQTATHFPKQDMLALGNLDAYLRTVEALNAKELDDWTVLWTIVGPGRHLANGEEPLLRQALARASYEAKLMRINANQLLAAIREEQLLSSDELADADKEEKAELKGYLTNTPLCRRIGAAPDQYGGSPMNIDMLAPFDLKR